MRRVGLGLGYLLAFMFSAGAIAGLFFRDEYNKGLLDADKGKANTQIITWIYVEPHPLVANMFHAFSLVVGLSIPALMHAPRLLRAPPLLALIALFIVNNSYLEHLYVLEVTLTLTLNPHLHPHPDPPPPVLVLVLVLPGNPNPDPHPDPNPDPDPNPNLFPAGASLPRGQVPNPNPKNTKPST